MISGLSAIPLTPLRDDTVDEAAYIGLVGRLVTTGVDSIAALGSNGSYMYLDRAERRRRAFRGEQTAEFRADDDNVVSVAPVG